MRLPQYDYPRPLVCNCRAHGTRRHTPDITEAMHLGPLMDTHDYATIDTPVRRIRPGSLYQSQTEPRTHEQPRRCRSLKPRKDYTSDPGAEAHNTEKKHDFKDHILRALSMFSEPHCRASSCNKPTCKMMELLEPHNPNYRRACLIYLEGCHGVGKTTMLTNLKSAFDEKQLLSFFEPIGFWTSVYEDSLKRVYKATKQHRLHKKYATSTEVLSCQTKFSVALRTISKSVQGCIQPCAPLQQMTSEDAMVVFDRHIISSTVIYPLIQMRRGILSPCDMLGMFSTFQANAYDVITIVHLDPDETLCRIRKRGRQCEEGVDRQYIMDVNSAYHSVYCTWLFLRNCPIEICMRLCLDLITMKECAAECGLATPGILQQLFDKSLLKYFKDVMKMYKGSTCLFETIKQVCEELKKPYIITFDYNQVTSTSSPGHLALHRQLLNTEAIKTVYLNWTYLYKLSHGFSSENAFI